MKCAAAVGCIVAVMSVLVFEIIPSAGIWKIVILEQQLSARPSGNQLLVEHNIGGSNNNGGSSLNTKQEDEHVVSSITDAIASRVSTVISGILFSYSKEEDDHVLVSLDGIGRTGADSTLFRMGRDEPLSVKDKERLTHQAFRMHEKTFKQLQKEAAKRGISVSNLVNNILRNYMAYGMYFEQLAFVPVSKDFMRTIFSKMENDQDIEQYSRDLGTIVVNEYASNYFPNLNKETLIQFLELWFRRFQNCQHRIDIVEDSNKSARQHTFSINHDINVNFSIVLKRILSGFIEPITKSIVMFSEVTPGTITFSFET